MLDASKPKGFADNNFKFDENGRKLLKWVENTAGNLLKTLWQDGEIARKEQFLLLATVFSKGLY